MLVLTRKIGESIRIGKDVWVMVCAVKANGDVRLGFTAPPGVEILRRELLTDNEGREPKQ